MWDEDAQDFDGAAHPILSLKAGKIIEFRGSKSVNVGSAVKINPDMVEARKLRHWYDNDAGSEQVFENISAIESTENMQWHSLHEADVELHLGTTLNKPEFFQCKATITHVTPSAYKACTQHNCNKKLVEVVEGYWCPKCSAYNDEFKYRIILNVTDFVERKNNNETDYYSRI